MVLLYPKGIKGTRVGLGGVTVSKLGLSLSPLITGGVTVSKFDLSLSSFEFVTLKLLNLILTSLLHFFPDHFLVQGLAISVQ